MTIVECPLNEKKLAENGTSGFGANLSAEDPEMRFNNFAVTINTRLDPTAAPSRQKSHCMPIGETISLPRRDASLLRAATANHRLRCHTFCGTKCLMRFD